MEAAKKVYKTAGITDPRREINVAELYEAFSFQEMLWTEAMFFCERGEGGKLVESGATEMTGDLPVNPSGGVLSTNTIGATAMMRQAEAAMQVMGRAGAASDRRGANGNRARVGRRHSVSHVDDRERRKELSTFMILQGDITIPYKWTTGPAIGRFLAELRDNARLVGARCAKCNKVYVPPTDVCGQCFKPLDEWVELTGEGKIIAVTVVHYQLPWSPVAAALHACACQTGRRRH